MKKALSLLLVVLGLGTDAVTAGVPNGGGDTTVADMFQTTPDGSQPTTATTETPITTDAGATTPTSFELRAGESVYRSVEEAQRGIEHKDSLINLLRNQAIQQTGVDPLTGQRVGQAGQQIPQGQPQAPTRYLDNPNQYAKDLTEAAQMGAQTGDYSRYHSIQRQLQSEQMNEQFAPFMPVLQSFVETSAVQQVAAVKPEFSKFYNSPEFKKTLDANPLLKMGIENAKQNPALANQLPELYKQVYTVAENESLRRQLAEFQKAQQLQTSNAQNVRPTAQPTTLQPQTTTINGADPRTDAEARKAMLKALEAKGVLNTPITVLG